MIAYTTPVKDRVIIDPVTGLAKTKKDWNRKTKRPYKRRTNYKTNLGIARNNPNYSKLWMRQNRAQRSMLQPTVCWLIALVKFKEITPQRGSDDRRH